MNAVEQTSLQLEAKLKHRAVPSMKHACKLKMLLQAVQRMSWQSRTMPLHLKSTPRGANPYTVLSDIRT